MIEDEIKFLRERAAALRELALRAPAIGEALRRLASDMYARAAELERNAGRSQPGG